MRKGGREQETDEPRSGTATVYSVPASIPLEGCALFHLLHSPGGGLLYGHASLSRESRGRREKGDGILDVSTT